MEIDTAGGIFTTLPVMAVNRGRADSTTLDFAHCANGTWITDLVFVNLETELSGPALTPFHRTIPPSRPAIYFYDTEGSLIDPELLVDITGDLEITEDGALTVRTEMEPLGVLTISTHGRREIVSGSVKVLSEGLIGGMARFAHPALGLAGVGANSPRQRRPVPSPPPGGRNHDGGCAPQPGIESGAASVRIEKRGRAARRREYPSGSQRANGPVHRPGVRHRRYVRLRRVGAVSDARAGTLLRGGLRTGWRRPDLHRPACGPGGGGALTSRKSRTVGRAKTATTGHRTSQRYVELKDLLAKPLPYIRIDTFEIWRSRRIFPDGASLYETPA